MAMVLHPTPIRGHQNIPCLDILQCSRLAHHVRFTSRRRRTRQLCQWPGELPLPPPVDLDERFIHPSNVRVCGISFGACAACSF